MAQLNFACLDRCSFYGQLLCDEAKWSTRKAVEECYAEGNADGIVDMIGDSYALPFVRHNWPALLQRGIYEACLCSAYTRAGVNNSGFSIQLLEWMFRIADKEKLRAAGDELPEGESFTIYRGVSGLRHRRRVRSFSWTVELDKARWFATRFKLADPAVYIARVGRGEVLAYCREEQEIICRPRTCKLLEKLQHQHSLVKAG